MEQEKVVEKKVPAFAECDRISGEVVIVHAVLQCDSEGKSAVSYHLTPHDAKIGASGLGYSGPDGDVVPMLALKLSDGRYALVPEVIVITKNPEAEAKLREAAIKKLSPAEYAALMGSPSK